MATWLWVSDLDPKNDWLELLSMSWGSGSSGRGSYGSGAGKVSLQDIHLTLKPGRFATRLMSWLLRGDTKKVYVFFDPQTEYQFSGALLSSLSTSGQDIYALSINFESMKVEYSGEP